MENSDNYLFEQHSAQIEMVRKSGHDIRNDMTKINCKIEAFSEKIDKLIDKLESLEKEQITREAQMQLIKSSIPWMKSIAFAFISLLLINHDKILLIAKHWVTKT